MSIRKGSSIIAGTDTGDGLSITRNSSSQLQTVGVINQNNTSTALKQWSGTRTQYDAIVSKDSNTLYNITDDTDVSLTILEVLYPVGSIYITTANTCPLVSLISGSSWANVGTSIITGVSIPSTIPVYGNGYGLTLTNNNQTLGIAHDSANAATAIGGTNQPWVTVGTGTSRNNAQQATALGLPTASQIGSDLSKSGIIAKSDNITKTSLTVNIFQRTA